MSRARFAFVLAIVALAAAPAVAGLYSPAEPCPFQIGPDGTAAELSFGTLTAGEFRLRYTTLLNAADANPARTDNSDRKAYLARIADLEPRAKSLPPGELAGLAADLYRVGEADRAYKLLAPLRNDRVPDFRVLANLAHVEAGRGSWDDAIPVHELAAFDTDFPADFAGTTPAQRAWLRKLERTHYTRWLAVRRDRAAKKVPPADEDVFPLFAAKFVGESGGYEPGTIAAAEKAKLPPDAVAVVQQLMLWTPDDDGLRWLLAELYAASDRLREADLLFDQLVWSRQYSNRRVLMAHRAAVRDAVAKLPKGVPPVEVAIAPPDADKPDGTQFLPSRDRVIAVAAGFGVLAGGLGFLQLRAIVRRRRG